jgi:hypothetical protein
MTMRASLLGVLAAAAVLLGTGGGCTPNEGIDPSKLPENIRADYEVFARKCSKCHSLARPLQSNISDDQQWVLYVNRMRRQPASGISPEDQTVILRYLHYYAAELRRKQAEKNAPPLPQNVPVLTPSASPPANGNGNGNADGGGL